MKFFEKLSQDYSIKLDFQQKEAVKHTSGTALVLAGPGSGKTTVIVSRTAYLIMDVGIRPENILTVTFNRAAKIEMESRFKRIFGTSINAEVRFSTIHSFCNVVVKHYERLKGKSLKRIEGSQEEDGKRKILKDIYFELNEAVLNDDELETLTNEISLVKNSMIRDFEGVSFSTRNFVNIYKAYEDYKKSNLFIDFDDMLSYAYSIFVKFPNILEYYRNKYKYIQIDEGQDLSKIQFEIVKLLCKPHNNLFIVADDDQSIYGFRGADPGHILAIEKEFEKFTIFKMENNYRSCKSIVDISSSLIKRNSIRYDKNHITNNEYGIEPVIAQPRDEISQGRFLVEAINSMKSRKTKSIGILFRNNLSSIIIADTFSRHGIKFIVRQNKVNFFNHWAIQDILAFLRFALDPEDTEAFLRICFKMNRFLSKTMVEYGLNENVKGGIIDTILTFDQLKDFQISRIKGIKDEFKKMSAMQTSNALKYIENDFKYFESVKEYCQITGLCFEYIYRLFGILKSLSTEYTDIPRFVMRIKELENILSKKAERCSESNITLTTIHSSKGLEYDRVFIVDAVENEIPGRKAVDTASRNGDSKLLEEERRLFYVGMTRAKEEVFLISPQNTNDEISSRSMFIGEVLSIMNKKNTDNLNEGAIVIHKHFGRGIITAVMGRCENDQVTLEIAFNGIRRKLDYRTCNENRLIEVYKYQ